MLEKEHKAVGILLEFWEELRACWGEDLIDVLRCGDLSTRAYTFESVWQMMCAAVKRTCAEVPRDCHGHHSSHCHPTGWQTGFDFSNHSRLVLRSTFQATSLRLFEIPSDEVTTDRLCFNGAPPPLSPQLNPLLHLAPIRSADNAVLKVAAI